MAALREAVLGVVRDVNPGGLSLKGCLRAMLACFREVVTYGIQQGAGAALTAAQLCSVHDLRRLEPGFPNDSDPWEQEKLVGKFTTTAETITAVIDMGDVILSAFLGQ